MTEYACEVCARLLPPENVRLDLGLVSCPGCRAVYDLTGRKGRALREAGVEVPARVRQSVPMPARFRVEDDGVNLTVRYRWFTASHLLLAVFALFWNGVVLMMYAGMVRELLHGKSLPAGWLTLAFPGLHLLVGLAVGYAALACLLNTTRVDASRHGLAVAHGPLRWPGTRTWARGELTQLFGQQQVTKAKNTRSVRWHLMALDARGEQVRVLDVLDTADQVLWLEQALEKRLGIPDAPVEGELARRQRA